jgi:DNA repair protein RecO (recombination protein O)
MALPKYWSDDCLILKRTNYGEADRIVVLLSRRFGKMAAVAKGVRKVTSRKAPHVEPYSLTRLYFVSTKGLPLITQAETVHRFGDMNLELSIASLAFQLGEIVGEMLNEGEAHEVIFDRLSQTLAALTQAEPHEAEELVTAFQLFLLDQLGYGQPQDESPLDYIERLLDRRLKSPRLNIL